jgi:hypothetical protein
MPFIPIIIAAIAAIVGAVQARQQAQFQRQAQRYNAKVAENNALTASMQAKYDAKRIASRNARLAALRRASIAKSGVSLASGSALDIQYDEQTEMALDELAAQYQGQVRSVGYMGQARYARWVGDNARREGRFAVAGALIAGASEIAGQYASANQGNSLLT